MESLNGVNAITIVFAALCIFAIAYRFYGLWVAQKVLNINAARETPANRFEDGKDYVPTNKYVLFGITLPPLRLPVRCSVRCWQRSSAIYLVCFGS